MGIKIIELIKELPLGIVKDCYNLMLKVSPITLTRDENNGIIEIVWSENKEIGVGATETLLFRDGDDLYFSEWYENPKYHENVIVRDLKTGKIKEKQPGYLCRLPDGFYINQDGPKGDHVFDSDLKELILEDKRAESIELFMNLTGENLKEAERHIDNLSRLL